MEVGDRVIYYTHEASDSAHRTVDYFAIVLAVISDDLIDVVVFPPGGPIQFLRVSRFNPEEPGPVGLSYWRPKGESPPEFDKIYRHYHHPEWTAMVARQQDELAKAAPADRDGLKDKHKKERDALYTKLERDTPNRPEPERMQNPPQGRPRLSEFRTGEFKPGEPK